MLKKIEKKCTDNCVALIVWKNCSLLMIERNNPPFGFSIPGGHLEEKENFEKAAVRELEEETGLTAVNLKLLFEDIIYSVIDGEGSVCSKGSKNPYYCKIYRASYKGDLKLNDKETKSVGWYDMFDIYTMALNTEKYLKNPVLKRELENFPIITPTCYKWLTIELKILDMIYYKNVFEVCLI